MGAIERLVVGLILGVCLAAFFLIGVPCMVFGVLWLKRKGW